MPTGVGIKTKGHQEMMLLKASLLIGLYLGIMVDNLSIMMTQKRRRTFYMSVKGLQEVEVDVIMAMRGTMETSNLR